MFVVHRRPHTEYTDVSVILRVNDATVTAAGFQQVELSLTDLAKLFGGIRVYNS